MSYEWWLAKRYIWSKRRHPFVGVTSTVSILGIIVGVAALIAVLAVMNGFDEELKARIIGMRSHLVIEKETEFRNWPILVRQLSKIDSITGASAYVEGQAFLQKADWGQGVLVRGIDPAREKSVSKFFGYLVQGNLTNDANGVVIGQELARRLGVGVGSEVSLLSQTIKKPMICRVEGIFASGMYEYDANLIFMNLKSAQNLFQMKEAVTGISIFLKDAEKATSVKKAMQTKLRHPYFVRTWMDMNKTLFGALELEKFVMFLILTLIIVVACLNIAGSLTLMVMDKTKDIGILKALGSTPASVRKIFAFDGLIVGGLGAGGGLLAGLLICIVLTNYSFIKLPAEIYYMEKLPVKMQGLDTIAIVGMALFLSFISSLYPAILAGRLEPVKALRYE